MKTKTSYRTAAVLLLLFAAGHQFGFRKVSPEWQADDVVRSMQSTHFVVQGLAARSYWGFYTGFGFFVTVLLVFSAVLAWELGSLTTDTLQRLSRLRWAFAICYAIITVMTWAYFFVAPGVFAAVITACLATAAWQRSHPMPA